MEREVIDGSELKDLIDAHSTAVKLVPASSAEVRGQRTEDRGQRTENREQRSDQSYL
jgi:hypothetical protein